MTVVDTHGDAGHSADAHAHHEHPPFLAHHWEDPQQQFEAGKLGMWLFLATEFLLFGGLFCGYAVYRFNHPEIFEYGSQFLDTQWGAINTVVLILSSLTMALAVSASQLGKTRALVTLLVLTFLGGVGFMSIKYVEYKHKFEHNIVWGTTFYEEPAHHPAGHGEAAQASSHEEDDAHAGDDRAAGPVGEEETDHASEPSVAVEPDASSAVAADTEAPAAEVTGEVVAGLPLPISAVPPPAEAPRGLAAGAVSQRAHAHDEHDDDDEHDEEEAAAHAEPDPRTDPNRPPNAHIFFGIYFCMTGLHGVHVLVGMGVIGWLIWRSARGEFSAEYFTPVDLGGLYWHVVDLIWIFLFPLLYLIG